MTKTLNLRIIQKQFKYNFFSETPLPEVSVQLTTPFLGIL